jgi:hypothetical protein
MQSKRPSLPIVLCLVTIVVLILTFIHNISSHEISIFSAADKKAVRDYYTLLNYHKFKACKKAHFYFSQCFCISTLESAYSNRNISLSELNRCNILIANNSKSWFMSTCNKSEWAAIDQCLNLDPQKPLCKQFQNCYSKNIFRLEEY